VGRVTLTRWSLWRESRLVTLILAIEIAAVVIPFLPSSHITKANIGVAELLASLSISYSALPAVGNAFDEPCTRALDRRSIRTCSPLGGWRQPSCCRQCWGPVCSLSQA